MLACHRAGKWEQATELLARMYDQDQLRPNVVCYTVAITACGTAQRPDEALDLLAAMKADGVRPNVITYNALISACGVAQQVDRALELLKVMEAEGVRPNVITYNAAISA